LGALQATTPPPPAESLLSDKNNYDNRRGKIPYLIYNKIKIRKK